MPAPAEKLRVIRFGMFEVDLQEAELRKGGVRIKLQDQPFLILTMLLERPGETITREELRKRLWPADTFVDFDHSLNSSIKKLREALGDDSENPRFIETLHRRGYRFIALSGGPESALLQRGNGHALTASGKSVPTTEESRYLAPIAPKGSQAALWKIAAGASFPLAAVVLGLLLYWPTPAPRIVRAQQLTNDGLPKESLVSDGNRIYITEGYPREYVIAQLARTGGETSALDLPFSNVSVKAVSREGSELLIERLDSDIPSVWSVPVPAGAPRRMGNLFGDGAVWAPDGKLIVANGNDLFVADHDGGHPRKFASAPGAPTDITFSPDGSLLRFTLTAKDGTSSIWESRHDGSAMHPLFPGWNHPAEECCGRWTPDGRYYVFQSAREGIFNIWIVRERSAWWRKNSHEPIQLTVGPLQLSSPVPSAQGEKLFAIGTHQRGELVRYDTRSNEFVPYLAGISALELDFSRDGQWLTYVSYPDRTLWRSKADGSSRLQLTRPPMGTAVPHWSPDGKQIAFAGITPGRPWNLFLVSVDGEDLQPIAPDAATNQIDAAWSADGKTLAFGHYPPVKINEANLKFHPCSIALINMANHEISELPGSQQLYAPRWSPNGRYIVALTWDEHRLMLFDLNQKRWRALAPRVNEVGYMTWARDSAYLYFDTSTSTESAFFRARISDSKLERLIDLKEKIRQPSSLLVSWSGLGPDDTALAIRDLTTQEVYALDLELP